MFVREFEQNTIFKQSIRSINDWDRAFATFVTVYSGAHPAETSQLIKYIMGKELSGLPSKGGDWAHYVVGFRCLRHTTSIPWDYFHAELHVHGGSVGRRQGLGQLREQRAAQFSCPN